MPEAIEVPEVIGQPGKEVMDQEAKAIIDAAKPCPFCGSTTLLLSEWCTDACEVVAAIECAECLAGAPFTAWQQRAADASNEEEKPHASA